MRNGWGRQWTARQERRGKAPSPAPFPLVRSPPWSAGNGAHPAEARPLQGEVPNRRSAGSLPHRGSDAGGGADTAWACVEVGIRGPHRKLGGGAGVESG